MAETRQPEPPGWGVSPGRHLTFSLSDGKRAIAARLDASMRGDESRRARLAVGETLMWCSISQLIRDLVSRAQRAQGLAEYGLILVLVSVAAIVTMMALGSSVNSMYSYAVTVFP
jgi:hypothetical protein